MSNWQCPSPHTQADLCFKGQLQSFHKMKTENVLKQVHALEASYLLAL